MKMQSGLLLLSCFLVFTGFRHTRDVKLSAPQPVQMEFVYTSASGSTFTGSFTSVGGIDDAGTSTMTVNQFGNVAHCTQVLNGAGGSITIVSQCQFSNMRGSWQIIDATGAYEGLKGNGRLLMMFPGGGILVTESYSGKVH